jgi:UPF0716 protein FxsA
VTNPPTASSRRRAGRVRALLLLVLLVEILVVLAVARAIGAPETVLLLLATSVLGGWLVRHEGARAWRALASALASGQVPDDRLGDSALVLVGGILLFVPGFVTDVVGLLFVLPFTRGPARRVLGRLVRGRLVWMPASVYVRRFPDQQGGWGGLGGRDVVPGEVVQGEVVQGEVVHGEVVPDADEPGSADPKDDSGPDARGDDGAGRTS